MTFAAESDDDMHFVSLKKKTATIETPLPASSSNLVTKAEIADHVGYCEFFAYRSLLHQFYCKQAPDTCTQPAVLDLINIGEDLPVKGRASRAHVFSHFAQRKYILSEACLPFAEYYPPLELSPQANWSEINSKYMQKTFDDQLQLSFDQKANHFDKGYFKDKAISIQQLNEQLAITPSETGVDKRPAIMRNVLRYNMNLFIASKNCEKIAIPPFVAHEELEVSAHLIKQKLAAGHQVVTQLFIPEPDGKSTGNHALVVANYKTECFSGFCTTRYQLLDSLGLYWSKSRVDGWVSEEELVKYLHPKASMVWLSPT